MGIILLHRSGLYRDIRGVKAVVRRSHQLVTGCVFDARSSAIARRSALRGQSSSLAAGTSAPGLVRIDRSPKIHVFGVTDWNSNQTTYAYDDANRMTSVTLPNGVVGSSTYDDASRLTDISWDKSGTTLASASYTVDGVGNRTHPDRSGWYAELFVRRRLPPGFGHLPRVGRPPIARTTTSPTAGP